ncbi:competence type IV pilus assembly protein ComGB [Macrococcus sp. DPC7161]|uniref:competence type IV pilus assembly protein ComGB n=1 Tax=Macrococcus sp. DPC7161 TaxID=2507060 RepID=UPI00100A358D|nr:competence type IV pilus assembly protein ComGB [Macrococcus sp. DPC7161]RXK19353.1 type II secretion system F family protein [Macrococcus sp. DPC7161]
MNMKNIFLKKPFKRYQIDFLLRTAELLESGFTFYESTVFLLNQYDKIQQTYKVDILSAIEKGATISEIYNQLLYSNHIVMQIYYSEQYGDVIETLKKCHLYALTQKMLMNQLIKTIQYPLLLICIFIGLILTVNQTVLPQFQSMYEAMGIQLSKELLWITTILFMLPKFLFVILIVIGLCIIYYFYFFKNKDIEKQILIIKKIPFLNKLYKLFITYKFSKDLSFFLSNGVMLIQIMDVLVKQDKDKLNQFIAYKINNDLSKGIQLVDSIEKLNLFETTFTHFISHGEKNSKLDIELSYYSQYVFEKLQFKIFKMIKSIQPVIFIILGLLIVAMYLIIILPMLQMMEGIK